MLRMNGMLDWQHNTITISDLTNQTQKATEYSTQQSSSPNTIRCKQSNQGAQSA